MDIAPISECGAMVAWTERILHKLFAVTEGHPQQHRNWSSGTGGPQFVVFPQQVHGTETGTGRL